MNNSENNMTFEERLAQVRLEQAQAKGEGIFGRIGFEQARVKGIAGDLKQGFRDGRNEVEANGKTVAENEAEAKAEVIASAKKWLTNPVNVVLTPVCAYTANKGMAQRGYGKHWYSPKRLVWQVLLNEMRCMALDPEEYVHNAKMTLDRVKGLKR